MNKKEKAERDKIKIDVRVRREKALQKLMIEIDESNLDIDMLLFKTV